MTTVTYDGHNAASPHCDKSHSTPPVNRPDSWYVAGRSGKGRKEDVPDDAPYLSLVEEDGIMMTGGSSKSRGTDGIVE